MRVLSVGPGAGVQPFVRSNSGLWLHKTGYGRAALLVFDADGAARAASSSCCHGSTASPTAVTASRAALCSSGHRTSSAQAPSNSGCPAHPLKDAAVVNTVQEWGCHHPPAR